MPDGLAATVVIRVPLPGDLHREVKVAAAEDGTTLIRLVQIAIAAALEKRPKGNK